MILRNATLLLALDAFALDLETTSVDPARARIVEVGAIRLAAGHIDAGRPFHRLVRPDVAIPPAASAIHGIDDAKVAGAPSFSAVWPELDAAIGANVVIGHALGFDLAVLRRECERTNLLFHRWPALDTRLLAQVVAPNLAAYTIEALSDLLAVEAADRHSAVGDALSAARIFVALVPRLRDAGIRTLGEAIEACRPLTRALEDAHRAGWDDVVGPPARTDAERTLARIDSYPYRHRVRDVMRTPVQFIPADASLASALAQLMQHGMSSLYVRSHGGDQAARPADTGIVTERDVLRALAKDGADALQTPVGAVMQKPLVAVAADAFVYRAIGRMSRLNIRHLGVVDERGAIVGALSVRDLLRSRTGKAAMLGDDIEAARDVASLGRAWAQLPQVAAALTAEGVAARDVAAVISRELGAATRQAAVIAEERLRRAGRGEPPSAYALAVLGSAGRGESLLAMDQDNALVFADGEPGGPQDQYFEELGRHVADILDAIGVPYCKGGVMARNPQWRGSVATWRRRIGDWIGRSAAADLLSVDIFFDMRPVHGDGRLCTLLWQEAFDAARGQVGFAKLLAEAAGSGDNALGFFRQFKTSEGRIDLKKAGLFAIVSTARVLAVCHHVVERATAARLAGLKALGIGAASDLDTLNEAQATLLEFLLAQQIEDIDRGTPPTNRVAIGPLSSSERSRLRAALDGIKHLDELRRDLLFKA